MKFQRNAAVTAVLMVIAVPAFAQQATPDPKRRDMEHRAERAEHMGPRMMSPEIALRMKGELKLTDAQASQLEALRKEIVADRQAKSRDAIDIHSRLEAGLIEREDVRKQFEGKHDALRQTMEQRQDRIAKILTPEQQERVQRASHHMMMQRMHGRQGARGKRGMGSMHGKRGHGHDGFGPGMMEPGSAPRRPPPPPRP